MKADASTVLANVRKGQFAPIYLLHGEEALYIDQVVHAIESSCIDESLRDFNQLTYYGRDTDAQTVLEAARRMPMMSERMLVVVREAQDLGSLSALEPYFERPNPTTVLVLAHKHRAVDGRKGFVKALVKSPDAIVLKSDPVPDYKLGQWMQGHLRARNIRMEDRASALLVDSIGNDLGAIDQALDKLELVCGTDTPITVDAVERNIGVSREFNTLELNDALGQRDAAKAFRIVQYFRSNPKGLALPMALGGLHAFFTRIYLARFNTHLDDKQLGSVLKLHPFVARMYRDYARSYDVEMLERVFEVLARSDLRSKGVGTSGRVDAPDILADLTIEILAA